MIKLITLSFLLTSTAYATKVEISDKNSLELNLKNELVEIKIPTVAHKVLTQWNPEFTPFSRSDYSKSILELFKDINPNQVAPTFPMAFIEDLDGNDKKDIVLLGADLKKQYVVALLHRDKKWTLIKVAELNIPNIKSSMIPNTTVSGTAETGVPVYVLPAEGEHATKLKEKKKIGIQVESYMGSGDVYEIINNKAVKFTL